MIMQLINKCKKVDNRMKRPSQAYSNKLIEGHKKNTNKMSQKFKKQITESSYFAISTIYKQ